MIEEFEYKGAWWLPEKLNEQIAGTLRFTPDDGASLDLMGSFRDIEDMGKTQKPQIILGVCEGKYITLFDSFETTWRASSPGVVTSSFRSNVVFQGAHFERMEDITFKRLSIHYSYLDEWVYVPGFEISDSTDRKERSVKHKVPDSVQAGIGNDYRIFINFTATGPSLSAVQKEASIKTRTYIGIETSAGKSFEEYRNIMYHIQNFLTLGVGEPVFPIAVEGTTEVNKKVANGKDYFPLVIIYYVVTHATKMARTIYPSDMLFTFKDISAKFERFLRNWIRKVELLEPVYIQYFGTLYNPRMYLQHSFLSLVQALESYHRSIMKNYELPEKEHDKRVEQILNSVPTNHKKWMEIQLRYSNEPNLRKRIMEVCDKLSPVVNDLIRDKKSFINKVVVTRNFLIHRDPHLKQQAAKGEELFRLSERLKAILEVCLLAELGFSLDEIKNLFSRKIRYMNLM